MLQRTTTTDTKVRTRRVNAIARSGDDFNDSAFIVFFMQIGELHHHLLARQSAIDKYQFAIFAMRNTTAIVTKLGHG